MSFSRDYAPAKPFALTISDVFNSQAIFSQWNDTATLDVSTYDNLSWSSPMADNSGGNAMLGVVIGGILVVLLVVFLFGGFGNLGGSKSVDVNIKPPVSTGSTR